MSSRPERSDRGICFFVLAAIATLAVRADAQTLSGRVTRAGVPVSGVVLALTDESGRPAGRAVSLEQGAYSIYLSAPGTYRVRALQIGWRPTSAGPFALRAGATTTANIDLTSQRIALEAMVVTGKSECRVNPDTSAAAFIAWEEARTALMATSLTRGEPLTMSSTISDRTLDRGGSRVVIDSTRNSTGLSLNPFVSLSGDSLARVGYVTRAANGERVYWAPDADVLLSESFIASHCLRVERSEARAANGGALIGVAFEPARTRRDIVDIAGVVWLDRASAELRAIDYQYVNTSPAVERAQPGGRVEFSRIPGGRWIVDRWSIRYPLIGMGVRPRNVAPVPGDIHPPQPSEELAGIKVTTGQVSDIRRGGDVLWERGRVSVNVRVVDSATGSPVAGVLVGVTTSTSSRATDSTGAVRIDRIAPGSVGIRLESPDLQSIGLTPFLTMIDAPVVQDATATVRIPSPRTVAVERCGARSLEWGQGILSGRVATGGATALAIAWQTSYSRLGGGDPVVAVEERAITTGPNGGFQLCGIPRDARVRVKREGAGNEGTVIQFRPGAVAAYVGVP